MKTRINFFSKIALLLFLFIATFAMAQAPNLMSYQAVVRNSAGTLISNQGIGVKISVLKTSAAGTEVYKELFNPNPITNSNGLLTLQIGSGLPLTGSFAAIDWSAGPYFVKSEIDPTGGTTYSVVSTSQLLSVPYALNAKTAQSVIGISGTNNKVPKFTSTNSLGNSQLSDDGTSVGINTSSANADVKFEVISSTGTNGIKSTFLGIPLSNITTPGAIYGRSKTGIGVIGNSETQNGVYGISGGEFGGVTGVNTGTGFGIWGISIGTGKAGKFEGNVDVEGQLKVNGKTTDVGSPVIGNANSTAGALDGGIKGTYDIAYRGVGVQGIGWLGIKFADAKSAFGSNDDVGVYGSGNNVGVEGTAALGTGVAGYTRGTTLPGTAGYGNSYGIYGSAKTIGDSTPAGTRYGVYGTAAGATGTNWAGYFAGNVQITGSISKGSGTFKIDHPLDPENKYLYHSFVESPDMMNIYNGNITTDGSGNAKVVMPAYFNALNKDFRYQLTPIGTFAQAIISEEINGNTFAIKTDKPNVKVSWQVTGVRHDKFAEAHRVIPEVAKEAEMRGKYLHAKEWGKPDSQSIDSVTRPSDQPISTARPSK